MLFKESGTFLHWQRTVWSVNSVFSSTLRSLETARFRHRRCANLFVEFHFIFLCSSPLIPSPIPVGGSVLNLREQFRLSCADQTPPARQQADFLSRPNFSLAQHIVNSVHCHDVNLNQLFCDIIFRLKLCLSRYVGKTVRCSGERLGRTLQ